MSVSCLSGIIPPVPTCFTAEGKFDRENQSRLIDFLIDSDVDGLFFLGSAGEFAAMSEKQRKEVAEFCIHHVKGRKPVLIGTGYTGTAPAIGLSLHAQEFGADYVVVINPFYHLLSDAALFSHYQLISSELHIPVLIYNFPALTGQSVPVSVITRLACECPAIVGLKDTVNAMTHIRETLHSVKPLRHDFAVFAGYDENLLGTLILGGDGAIAASANFAPQLMCGIFRAWQRGDYAHAISLHQQVTNLAGLYEAHLPFHAALKFAISQMAINIPTHVLPPAEVLETHHKEMVLLILKAFSANE